MDTRDARGRSCLELRQSETEKRAVLTNMTADRPYEHKNGIMLRGMERMKLYVDGRLA